MSNVNTEIQVGGIMGINGFVGCLAGVSFGVLLSSTDWQMMAASTASFALCLVFFKLRGIE